MKQRRRPRRRTPFPFLAVLVVMVVTGVISYRQEARRLAASLALRQEQLLGRLPITLAGPMWNLQYDMILETVAAEMLDTDLQAIRVSSLTMSIGKTRAGDGEVLFWTPQVSSPSRPETASLTPRTRASTPT